jgi:hypothetical protein
MRGMRRDTEDSRRSLARGEERRAALRRETGPTAQKAVCNVLHREVGNTLHRTAGSRQDTEL